MATDIPIQWSSTKCIAINNIGGAAAQVFGQNSRRVGLRFHNPGTTSIYVYPIGVTPTPNTGLLGGTFNIIPENDITIYGGNTMSIHDLSGAWGAFAATGSNQPLTVWEFVA